MTEGRSRMAVRNPRGGCSACVLLSHRGGGEFRRLIGSVFQDLARRKLERTDRASVRYEDRPSWEKFYVMRCRVAIGVLWKFSIRESPIPSLMLFRLLGHLPDCIAEPGLKSRSIADYEFSARRSGSQSPPRTKLKRAQAETLGLTKAARCRLL